MYFCIDPAAKPALGSYFSSSLNFEANLLLSAVSAGY